MTGQPSGDDGESATAAYPSSKGRHAQATSIGPYIVMAVNSQRPFEWPLRIPLGDAERLNFRRGSTRTVRRNVAVDGVRTCDVFVADTTVGKDHAFIDRAADGRFWLWDCGSKNGTSRNGSELTEPVELHDGDWVGVGCSFFLFRSDVHVTGAFASSLEVESGGSMASLNPLLAETLGRAARMAETDEPLLISGPSGSGRRTLARQIHERSGRTGHFVEVPASDFLERLHSFTEARDGTLYIRDVENLNDEACACIGRGLLNEDELCGTTNTVRLLGSCGDGAVAALASVLTPVFGGRLVSLPPLHLRREDLGGMVAEILRRHGAPTHLTFRRSLSRALGAHRWYANIAGLEEGIRQGLAHLGDDTALELVHLPKPIQETETQALERRRFVEVVRRLDGNVTALARELGLTRRAVYRRAEKYGVDLSEYRPGNGDE